MLETFYLTVFRPTTAQISPYTGGIIGLLIILILALNAAAQVGLGIGGVVGFTLLFLLAGCIGWYWFAASINQLALLLGGQGNVRVTLGAIAQGLWPLLLTGPAIAARQWSTEFSAMFSLAITLGLLITLTLAIRRAHQFDWGEAIVSLAGTLLLSLFALFGLLVWPLMIILGTG